MVVRVAKWAGLGSCLLLCALWIVSDHWVISRFDGAFGGGVMATADSGSVRVFWHRRVGTGSTRTRREWWVRRRGTGPLYAGENGTLRWPGWPAARDMTVGATRMISVDAPLWAPLALVGAPTALAWRYDRRRARAGGCAACGYDRAGLPAGAPCPECGRVDVGAALARIMRA